MFKVDTIRRQVLLNSSLDAEEVDVQGQMMELVIQFGYVVLFSTVFPLCAFVCFVSNAINLQSMRLELDLKRRSIPSVSIGIGVYLDMLEFLSIVSVAINIGIAYFTSHDTREFFANESGFNQDPMINFAFLVIGIEHLLYFLKIVLRDVLQADLGDGDMNDAKQRINNILEEKHKKEAKTRQTKEYEDEYRRMIETRNKLKSRWMEKALENLEREAREKKEREMNEKKWAKEADRLNKLGNKHTNLQPIDHETKMLRNGVEVMMWYYPDGRKEQDPHRD